jgi:zinc transporter
MDSTTLSPSTPSATPDAPPPPPFKAFCPDGGLILATRLPGAQGDLGGNRRGWSELAAPAEPPPLWVHLDHTRPRAQVWLREESGLDPIVAEALLAEETRPRVQEFGEEGGGGGERGRGLLVILRGINASANDGQGELMAIRMWLSPVQVITLRQHHSRNIAALRARAAKGTAPATPGAFLAALAAGLVNNLDPAIRQIEDRLDAIEEAMLDGDDDEHRRTQLAAIRRQAIAYRRHMVPQRDALDTLVHGDSPLLSPRDRATLRVAMEHCTRINEALEELRDRAAVTQDEMRARHEARIGRTIYLLTLVATVALPLTIITGLLGINVGGIPLADSPWGFAVVCGALLAIAAGEVALFKRMRWL